MKREIIKPNDKEHCWLFGGSIRQDGYGQVSLNGKWHMAHRISFKLFNPSVRNIKSKVICHRCDNPLCVNPEHLFVGTQQDNLSDMRAKGRERGVGYINRQKSNCNNGHQLSGKNLRIEGKAKARRCRECERIKKKVKREAAKWLEK